MHMSALDNAGMRNEALRRIMDERTWSALKVAKLLDRSAHTVRQWVADQREIPDHTLRLLQLLAERESKAVSV